MLGYVAHQKYGTCLSQTALVYAEKKKLLYFRLQRKKIFQYAQQETNNVANWL